MRLRLSRDRAEQLLRTIGISAPPVDVFRVARYLKIKVIEDQLDPDVSGLLITDATGTRICVNKSHHENRRRFTIAHEVGHYALGHHFEAGSRVHVDRTGVFVSARSARSAQGVDSNEIEANQFASALLVPQFLLDAELKGSTTPLSDFSVEQLAGAFKVSEHAMTIRLSRLGLL
jgi:Zn-dependent peptidase ImmA (M78 family)